MKFIGTKEINTERLLLRKVRKEDAEVAYNNWCNDPEVCKYVLWSKHKSVETTQRLYEMWEHEYEDDKTFRWIVELKDTKELIGTIDVVSKKYIDFGTCEIGYVYGKKYWGNGYATEALKAVIKYLFEECDAETIFAEFLTRNPASGRVMEKSGMIYEGEVKSRVVDNDGNRNDIRSYSITKEQFIKE